MSPRVLAFGCHPDDIEFMVGGTLALLAEAGCDIHLATMAGGEMGSPELPPAQIRAVRHGESIAAASVIGASYHYAGGYDIEIEYSAEYRRRAVRVMREVNPDLVLTHAPTDYLIDHEETSRLVRTAAFVAPIPNFDCGVPSTPTDRIPHLYYWNALGLKDIFGRPLPLTCAVDISSVLDTKRQMLACHDSQRAWLREINGWDEYLDNMETQSRQEGQRAGVDAAEGFIQHLGAGHPTDHLLAELLPDHCLSAE